MPLSTSLIQRTVDGKLPFDEPPHHVRSRHLGSAKIPKGPESVRVTEAMSIAVMIELPQAPEALEAAAGIHEYQIGILHVPWKDEIDEKPPET
ncbi:hypothetical protein MSAN_00033800 [Mycena sanguinolenta]|uniref:Uncharacterized protein n=1 Tax=Mycena sanguinolenta TaxID=230812 RepID=A0A8H6ZEG4_9AGAR|nr:hypothetical protein MSAN_00033800 [Mycena sanguinolenta]